MNQLTTYWRQILLCAIILTLIVLLLMQGNAPFINPVYQDRIDSAQKRIEDSARMIKYYNFLDSVYGKKLDTIKNAIKQVRKNRTEIRNYYIPQIEEINEYTPSELDTFFKNRYKY